MGSATLKVVRHEVRLEDSSSHSYTSAHLEQELHLLLSYGFHSACYIYHLWALRKQILVCKTFVTFLRILFISSRKFKKKKREKKVCYSFTASKHIFQQSKGMLCLNLLIILYRICCKILYLRLQTFCLKSLIGNVNESLQEGWNSHIRSSMILWISVQKWSISEAYNLLNSITCFWALSSSWVCINFSLSCKDRIFSSITHNVAIQHRASHPPQPFTVWM